MAENSTTTEAVSSSTGSTVANVASVAAKGVGIGILAAIGVDAYQGIKNFFSKRSDEKKSQKELEDAAELKALRKLHNKK